jgi:transcriptional regulator with XRE-family HTH domain
MTIEMNNDREWLEKLAERENQGAVSAGGWVARSLEQESASLLRQPPRVFGQLIEFARRERGFSLETLARQADVDLAELVEIERDPKAVPEPRTVHQLADVLGLPAPKLMVLAGLTRPRDESLTEAAIRFAARSEPSATLSAAEKEVLEEFVKVLSGAVGER